jgi:UPF0755 protein
MLFKKSSKRIIQLLLLALLLCGVYVWYALQSSVNVQTPVSVYIPRGAGVTSAIDSLSKHVGIPHRWLLTACSRVILKFSNETVQSGWVIIHPDDNQMDLIRGLFSSHRRPSVKITIPEGYTFRDIASLIKHKLESDSSAFVRWCESDSVRAYYKIQSPSLEGYLKPDTYFFYYKESADHVGEVLVSAFRKNHNIESLFSLDDYQIDSVLTLASIVQAEAADVAEMPVIAGVYANRLRMGMKLEADPTVQYGFKWKRRVLNKHLDAEHAYNTYVIHGLPPGPINNPGTIAINAALNPAKHSYVYFVAKGDGSGQHRFSSSGSEHMANVRKYRRNKH